MSYHVPGWGYSSIRRRQTLSPQAEHVRPASAMDPQTHPSRAPTPQSFLRPPSSLETGILASRPPSTAPLLPERAPSGARASYTPTTLPHSRNRLHQNETPANIAPTTESSPTFPFCLARRLSIYKPKVSTRRFSFSHLKSKQQGIPAPNASYELSPLRIKTPKTSKSTQIVERSKMAERPLGNITNTGQRRLSSIDVERKENTGNAVTPATDSEHANDAYQRFSYATGPGPVIVDVTVSPLGDTPTFRTENIARPVKGKGKMVEVKRKSRSVDVATFHAQQGKMQDQTLDGKGMSVDMGLSRNHAEVMRSWRDKPLPVLPRTDTTPWIEDLERGMGFEPFEVVFD
ncbi:MAG: hypothetical protein Q9159_002533 [Coniocarpon cinnabarinum]